MRETVVGVFHFPAGRFLHDSLASLFDKQLRISVLYLQSTMALISHPFRSEVSNLQDKKQLGKALGGSLSLLSTSVDSSKKYALMCNRLTF